MNNMQLLKCNFKIFKKLEHLQKENMIKLIYKKLDQL